MTVFSLPLELVHKILRMGVADLTAKEGASKQDHRAPASFITSFLSSASLVDRIWRTAAQRLLLVNTLMTERNWYQLKTQLEIKGITEQVRFIRVDSRSQVDFVLGDMVATLSGLVVLEAVGGGTALWGFTKLLCFSETSIFAGPSSSSVMFPPPRYGIRLVISNLVGTCDATRAFLIACTLASAISLTNILETFDTLLKAIKEWRRYNEGSGMFKVQHLHIQCSHLSRVLRRPRTAWHTDQMEWLDLAEAFPNLHLQILPSLPLCRVLDHGLELNLTPEQANEVLQRLVATSVGLKELVLPSALASEAVRESCDKSQVKLKIE